MVDKESSLQLKKSPATLMRPNVSLDQDTILHLTDIKDGSNEEVDDIMKDEATLTMEATSVIEKIVGGNATDLKETKAEKSDHDVPPEKILEKDERKKDGEEQGKSIADKDDRIQVLQAEIEKLQKENSELLKEPKGDANASAEEGEASETPPQLVRSPHVRSQVGAIHIVPSNGSQTTTDAPDLEDPTVNTSNQEALPQQSSLNNTHVVGEDHVVDVVQATEIPDAGCVEEKVVAAKSMNDKVVWSRRKVVPCALLILILGIILSCSIVIPLTNRPDNSSQDNNSTQKYEGIDLGTLYSCKSDPQNCGCFYTQADYRGTINVTQSGKTCQSWASHTPHEHKHSDFSKYSELEGHNYCRNPDSNSGGAWCYTTDNETRWELCDVPSCPTELQNSTISPVPEPVVVADTCTDRHTTSALSFDGIHSRIYFRNSTFSRLNLEGPFTVQSWLKPTEKYDFSTIFSNKEGGDSRPGLAFTINGWRNNDAKLHLEGTSSKAETLDTIEWDTWQHIALTYDGENPAFFVNGNQIPHKFENVGGPFRIDPSYLETLIGDFPGYDGVGGYAGNMAEFRVYDYARSGEEIRWDLNCQVAPIEPGLIAYYSFVEEDEESAFDASPSSHHGELRNHEKGGFSYVEGVSLCNYCSDES